MEYQRKKGFVRAKKCSKSKKKRNKKLIKTGWSFKKIIKEQKPGKVKDKKDVKY